MRGPTPPARGSAARAGRSRIAVGLALSAPLPALWLRASDAHLSHALEALLFGLAIVGAAFVLSWAAEVAQLDISAGLAIAGLALIAVLPEYAVDFVFAWQGGESVQAYGSTCPSGEPLSRTLMAEQVWDINFHSDWNVLEVAIRRLRAKVDDPFPTKLIHTVRGVGYVLEERAA